MKKLLYVLIILLIVLLMLLPRCHPFVNMQDDRIVLRDDVTCVSHLKNNETLIIQLGAL